MALHTSEQGRPVLIQAAFSHLELAVENIVAQSQVLQARDSTPIQAAVKRLQGLNGRLIASPSIQLSGASSEELVNGSDVAKGRKECNSPPFTVVRSNSSEVELSTPVRAPTNTLIETATKDGTKSTSEHRASVGSRPSTDTRTSTTVRLQDWLIRLMDIFDQLDSDKTGAIDLAEWKAATEAVGLPVEDAENVFKVVDTTRDGIVDRVEWLHMLESVQTGTCPRSVKKFSTALAEVFSKNGRVYVKPPRPQIFWLLRPDEVKRIIWDLFVMVLLFYVAVMLPYNLGYKIEDSLAFDVAENAVDCFFLLDVFLNFRTGYYDNEVLVLDQRLIALHYLRTWFLLDFLTCLPLEKFTAGLIPDMQAAKLLKVGKVVKVLKLLRLAKLKALFKDSDFVDWIEERLVMSSFAQTVVKVLGLLMVLSITCHWVACAMKAVGTWEHGDPPQELHYVAGLYWAMTTLTTVGYGDLTPATREEMMFAIGAMVVGGVFYGYMIGKISSTIAQNDLNVAAYNERMRLVHSWLSYHKELPSVLKRRVKHFFQKHLQNKPAADDTTMINDLTPALAHDVSFFLVQEEVRCNVLFKSLPNGAFAHIMPLLEKQDYEPHERLVTNGDVGDGLYIITQGVAYYEDGYQWVSASDHDDRDNTDPERQARLSAGDSFGEEVLLGLEEFFHYTIATETVTMMLYISKAAFNERFKRMPDMLHKMKSNFVGNRATKSTDNLPGPMAVANAGGARFPSDFPNAVLASLNAIKSSVQIMGQRMEARLPENTVSEL